MHTSQTLTINLQPQQEYVALRDHLENVIDYMELLKEKNRKCTPTHYQNPSLRKNCPYSEFFWSLFSRIWTEYVKIRSISPYSV